MPFDQPGFDPGLFYGVSGLVQSSGIFHVYDADFRVFAYLCCFVLVAPTCTSTD